MKPPFKMTEVQMRVVAMVGMMVMAYMVLIVAFKLSH